MVYIPCFSAPCPNPQPQVYFCFLRWFHTCFILCFQCIHCARVVPFYSKLFNSVFFNLFFQTEVKCYFLIFRGGWKNNPDIFSVFFFFRFFFSSDVLMFLLMLLLQTGHKTLHVLFTTQQHWKWSQFLLDWLILCAKPFGQECALWICWYE